jgi:hypothetical protein
VSEPPTTRRPALPARRRLALENWLIPIEHWHAITDSAPEQLDKNIRQLASAIIWCQISSGELRYAPTSHRPNRPQPRWHSIPRWTTRRSIASPLPPLAETITALADQLAIHIDNTGYATGWLATQSIEQFDARQEIERRSRDERRMV